MMEPLPVPRPRVLSDRAADRRLRRDGFVKLRNVVPTRVCHLLRSAYGDLHGWTGTGFEPDLVNPDSGYRRSASEALAVELDEIVGRLFVGFKPFLRNFLCKWTGEGSELYLHRDWMYVDERSGSRSYVTWIALEDITGHNGQLRVLRGSHRLDQMLRGTHLEAPWMDHEGVIRARLESVPVSVGDAIVFDNALVHCSYPNNSADPRLVAAVGMRPRDADLVYWRRCSETHAQRWAVDESFFLTETPQSLMERPPPGRERERATTGEVNLSEQQLSALLDEVALAGHGRFARLVERARSDWFGRSAGVESGRT